MMTAAIPAPRTMLSPLWRALWTMAAVSVVPACASRKPAEPATAIATGVRPPAPAAREQGWTRVIVQLRVVGGGSDTERAAAIKLAREALLRELALVPHRLTRAYDTIAFVALELSPAARAVVERSALTAGIEPDALSAPQ